MPSPDVLRYSLPTSFPPLTRHLPTPHFASPDAPPHMSCASHLTSRASSPLTFPSPHPPVPARPLTFCLSPLDIARPSAPHLSSTIHLPPLPRNFVPLVSLFLSLSFARSLPSLISPSPIQAAAALKARKMKSAKREGAGIVNREGVGNVEEEDSGVCDEAGYRDDADRDTLMRSTPSRLTLPAPSRLALFILRPFSAAAAL